MDVWEYTLTVKEVRCIFVVTKIPWRLINLPLNRNCPYEYLPAWSMEESCRFQEYPSLGSAPIQLCSPTDLGTVNIIGLLQLVGCEWYLMNKQPGVTMVHVVPKHWWKRRLSYLFNLITVFKSISRYEVCEMKRRNFTAAGTTFVSDLLWIYYPQMQCLSQEEHTSKDKC